MYHFLVCQDLDLSSKTIYITVFTTADGSVLGGLASVHRRSFLTSFEVKASLRVSP